MAGDPAMAARQQQSAVQSMLAHDRASGGGGGGDGGGEAGLGIGEYGIKFVGSYGINFMQVLNSGWLFQMAGVAGVTSAMQGFSMNQTMAGCRLPAGLYGTGTGSMWKSGGGGGAMMMG